MWCVRDVLYAVLYVRVSCFVVCGCAVSRRYIDDCNCDMFSVVNVYLDHLKFCVVCINGRGYVCCRECYVVSNECNEPTPYVMLSLTSVMSPPPALFYLSVRTMVKFCIIYDSIMIIIIIIIGL